MCIDWASAGADLYGTEGLDKSSATLDVQFLPCNVKETLLGGTEDRIPAKCNVDQKAAIGYVGPMQMVAIFNEGNFQMD